MAKREDIREQLPEGAIIFDSPAYDNSIIGITTDDRVVYSYERMVAELMADTFDNMNMKAAIEYIDHNTVDMLRYLNPAPVIVHEATWPRRYVAQTEK